MSRPTVPVRLAYLTAGAAGMYCGSCLRDNSLVVALCRQGIDATLLPTYTPIRTDEPDASLDQVFFGGLNVYLQQRLPLMRYVPAILDRWLDTPWLIRRLARDGAPPNPRVLGQMTVSMLRGAEGYQRKEVQRLTAWLKHELRPNIINLSNLLIAGCVPTLKRELNVPIVVTLQGDDVFLESLTSAYRDQAVAQIKRLTEHIDAFIVFNDYYADFMSQYLDLPSSKIHTVPLGINLSDYQRFGERSSTPKRPPTIGYLARFAPEKGLHLLVDAVLAIRQQGRLPDVRLKLAGWSGSPHQDYAKQQLRRLDESDLDYECLGTVDREQKLEFLQSIDVLSVPTEFRDPKGLYVLEALAAGVPCVQPAHGAFPELLTNTSGGVLVPPGDTDQLAAALTELLADRERCYQLGQQGRAAVFQNHADEHMAARTLQVYDELLAAGV